MKTEIEFNENGNLMKALSAQAGRKLKVINGGTFVIQQQNNRTFLMMFPNGNVKEVQFRKTAESLIKQRNARLKNKHHADLVITQVNWTFSFKHETIISTMNTPFLK
jgi:hypothetical protein